MFNRSVSRRVLATVALLVPLAVAATACGSDNEDLAQAADGVTASAPAPTTATDDTVPPSASCSTGCSTSMTIHVTNNSSHDLVFVKNDSNSPSSLDRAPAARIAAHGGTDSIGVKSSDAGGTEYEPIWRVDGSEDEVIAYYLTGTVLPNQAGCSGNNMRPAPSYMKTTCSIHHGFPIADYHPNATLVITDR